MSELEIGGRNIHFSNRITVLGEPPWILESFLNIGARLTPSYQDLKKIILETTITPHDIIKESEYRLNQTEMEVN